ERFDERHWIAALTIERDRDPLAKAERVPLGSAQAREGIAGEDPCLIRKAGGGGKRFGAADGDAPQTAVHRVARAAWRNRQRALAQKAHLVGAAECLVAHGREHLQIGRERAQRDLEAHLVVARAGAAVGDGVAAELHGYTGEGLRLHDPRGTHAQWVELAAAYVSHD